jgi:hypothetical protein
LYFSSFPRFQNNPQYQNTSQEQNNNQGFVQQGTCRPFPLLLLYNDFYLILTGQQHEDEQKSWLSEHKTLVGVRIQFTLVILCS